jgi:hypothetical protein
MSAIPTSELGMDLTLFSTLLPPTPLSLFLSLCVEPRYDFAVFGFFSDIIAKVFFPVQKGNTALVESFLVFGGAFIMREYPLCVGTLHTDINAYGVHVWNVWNSLWCKNLLSHTNI